MPCTHTPVTIHVHSHYRTSDDCLGDCNSMLYLLEGSDPTFRLVFSQTHGEYCNDSRP